MTNREIKNATVGKLVRLQQASRNRHPSVASEWPVHESYQPAELKQPSGGESIVASFLAMCLLTAPLMVFGLYSIVCCGWLLLGLLWWFFQSLISSV